MRRYRHDDKTDCQSNSHTLESGIACAGLGVTGSIAASGLSHLLQDVQIRQVQLQGDLRYLDAKALTRDLSIRFNGNYLEPHSRR